MIYELRGKVRSKSLTSVVIDVGGVGYQLQMSINGLDSLPKIDEDAHIYTYLHVREDILDLYGFKSKKERETFHLLISINGIGPKLAITILSGIGPSNLEDKIISGNIKALVSIPGVGTKIAKRIIIELKDKLIDLKDDSIGFNINGTNSQSFTDVFKALISLGYKEKDAKKACIKLDEKNELDDKLDVLIKKALRLLSKL